jgi:hypothetical protein
MRWGSRSSTKPTEFQENARKIAMDAFLEGKMTDGKRILEVERTRLSKPQAKKVARLIMRQPGRADDALAVLMMSMSASQAREEVAPQPSARVGDILYTSGGYEQTNVNFYEVVAVSGQSVTIRKISKHVVADHTYSVDVMPNPGSFVGEPKKKRVQKSGGGKYEVKVNDDHAWLWEGKPKPETAAGYGH